MELQDVTPPNAVKPAFNEVNESRQDKEQTINRAQERANREIPKARGVATQSISQAGAQSRLNALIDSVVPFLSIPQKRDARHSGGGCGGIGFRPIAGHGTV